MKKLIFLRNGRDDFTQVYEYKSLSFMGVWSTGEYIPKPSLGIDTCLYDIDELIKHDGYVKAIDYITRQMNIWYTTTCPSILSAHDEKHDPMWWNEEEHKWEIYFIEDGKLRNISEYTDKELRASHNIEHLYLTGGLDD